MTRGNFDKKLGVSVERLPAIFWSLSILSPGQTNSPLEEIFYVHAVSFYWFKWLMAKQCSNRQITWTKRAN